jgi:hypothetical protein
MIEVVAERKWGKKSFGGKSVLRSVAQQQVSAERQKVVFSDQKEKKEKSQ